MWQRLDSVVDWSHTTTKKAFPRRLKTIFRGGQTQPPQTKRHGKYDLFRGSYTPASVNQINKLKKEKAHQAHHGPGEPIHAPDPGRCRRIRAAAASCGLARARRRARVCAVAARPLDLLVPVSPAPAADSAVRGEEGGQIRLAATESPVLEGATTPLRSGPPTHHLPGDGPA